MNVATSKYYLPNKELHPRWETSREEFHEFQNSMHQLPSCALKGDTLTMVQNTNTSHEHSFLSYRAVGGSHDVLIRE